MRGLLAAILSLVCFVMACSSARADRRVALVIGNSSYQHTPRLSNPRNDANDMADELRRLGFEVIVSADASKQAMDRALSSFARASRDADAALFFYAGHGMQFQGTNYLMPVEATLEDQFSLRSEMVRVEDVLTAMEQARVRVLLLDACRNNPLADKMVRKITSASRAVASVRGFAPLEKSSGMVVAYATQPNDVASDGEGRNSPFTSAMLLNLRKPGLEIAQLFRLVAADVNAATKGKQTPEHSISLLSNFYLNQSESDEKVWSRVRTTSNPDALREFLNAHRTSFFAPDAKARLDQIELAARLEIERRETAEREKTVRLEREKAERDLSRRFQDEQKRMELQLAEREKAMSAAAAQREKELLLSLEKIEKASQNSAKEVADREAQLASLQRQIERDSKLSQEAFAAKEAELRREIEARARTQSDAEKAALLDRALATATQEQNDRDKELANARETERQARENALKQANDSALKLREEVDKLRKEVETAKAGSESARANPSAGSAKVAVLQPGAGELSAERLIREIKIGLKRIGCYNGMIDSNASTPQTQNALRAYAKYANLDPSSVQFDQTNYSRLKDQNDRICPLMCGARAIETNGRCVTKTCARGQILDAEGDCISKPWPRAKPAPAARARHYSRANASAPRASGKKCVNIGGRAFCE